MYKQEHQALSRIVDYLYRDEQKHYEEAGKPARHIFRDVLVLDDVLNEEEERVGLAEG